MDGSRDLDLGVVFQIMTLDESFALGRIPVFEGGHR